MIEFVESKKIDWPLVEHFLKDSEKINKWANFGPGSKKLEATLHDLLNLPPEIKVVMTASGTAALHSLASLAEYKSKKKLKWVTSSFSFPCVIQGSLAGKTTVIDCDENGCFDLNAITDDFDGLIITNIFGLFNLDPYREYCHAHNKLLLVDSATGFDSCAHYENEIISFHHTKPWGFGEGGCALVNKNDEHLLRCLCNFGVDCASSFANNWKISDVACAFIYQHLMNMPKNLNYNRVVKIALEFNFVPLVVQFSGTPVNVPLQAPIKIRHLKNDYIVLQKYYRPLMPTPNATKIYDHMVNFPCHTEIERLSDYDLRNCFKQVIEANI